MNFSLLAAGCLRNVWQVPKKKIGVSNVTTMTSVENQQLHFASRNFVQLLQMNLANVIHVNVKFMCNGLAERCEIKWK
jgi:hypothetical protein